MPLVGDNSLLHELRVIAAVELHVNATYIQHPALKSVYEKKANQLSVMSGNFYLIFSCYGTVFQLAQGLQDSTKQVT